MKVALVNHGIFPLQRGGMERHTYNMATHLLKLGVDVHVVVPECDVQESSPSHFPFPIHFLPWPKRWTWLASNHAFSQYVSEWLNAENPDIAFGQGFGLWAYLHRSHGQIPSIYHPHGLEMYGDHLTPMEWIKAQPFRCLVRYHQRKSDRVISLGGGLSRILLDRVGVAKEKLMEIPNAVDVERFPYADGVRKPKSFLFVGRFAFNKGMDLLLNAMESLDLTDTHWTFIGDGPMADLLKPVLAKHPNIKWNPSASEAELKEAYQTHEYLAFSSRFEGMPTVILEAMASGCVPLATRIGAVESMIEHSGSQANGVLVDPSSSSIRSGLESVLAWDTEVRTSHALNGRNKVTEKFTWPVVSDQFLSLFQEMLSE